MRTEKKFVYGGSIGVREADGIIHVSYAQRTVANIVAGIRGGTVVDLTKEEELALVKADLEEGPAWYSPGNWRETREQVIARLSEE